MKKRYMAPSAEAVRLGGKAALLDDKFGNSAYVGKRDKEDGSSDDDYTDQFAKPQQWSVWE